MRSYLTIALLSFLLIGCGVTYIHGIEERPKDIHIFGNSMMAWNNHGVKQELDELYNWTDVRVKIHDYAFIGALTEQIRNQWERAKEKGEQPDIAIVEGGANNVFANAWWCFEFKPNEIDDNCKNVVNNAASNLKALLVDLKLHKVSKVILIVPYHVRGVAAGFNYALEYAIPLLKDICEQPYCSTVELENWINPEDESLYFLDGVHPSGKGSRRIARVIYNALNVTQLEID